MQAIANAVLPSLIPLLPYLIVACAAFVAMEIVKGYHWLVAYAAAQWKIPLPDNASIDAGITAAVKLALADIAGDLKNGTLTIADLVKIVEDLVKALNPSADTTGVAAAVVAAASKAPTPSPPT